jgi:anti-sigma factor (TIGR02949 family)
MIDEALRCVDFVEVVTEWLEGAMSEERRSEVEEHLAICPHCLEYVGQMRATTRLLRQLADDDAPDDSHQRLLRAFRSWI